MVGLEPTLQAQAVQTNFSAALNLIPDAWCQVCSYSISGHLVLHSFIVLGRGAAGLCERFLGGLNCIGETQALHR